jgi:hypothetical protein
MTYSFNLGRSRSAPNGHYFREFDVENRAEGDVALVTVSVPLSVAGQ